MINIFKSLCKYRHECHEWKYKSRLKCQQLVIYPYKDSRILKWEYLAIDTYINCSKSLRKYFCLNN